MVLNEKYRDIESKLSYLNAEDKECYLGFYESIKHLPLCVKGPTEEINELVIARYMPLVKIFVDDYYKYKEEQLYNLDDFIQESIHGLIIGLNMYDGKNEKFKEYIYRKMINSVKLYLIDVKNFYEIIEEKIIDEEVVFQDIYKDSLNEMLRDIVDRLDLSLIDENIALEYYFSDDKISFKELSEKYNVPIKDVEKFCKKFLIVCKNYLRINPKLLNELKDIKSSINNFR